MRGWKANPRILRIDRMNAGRRGVRNDANGPPTDPDFASVGLLLPFEGLDAATTTTDESNNTHTVTMAGTMAIDTADKKYGDSSALGTGTAGDKISVTQDTSFNLVKANGFTAEMWFKLNTLQATSLMGQWQWPVATGRAWIAYVNASAGVSFWFQQGGATAQYHSANSLVAAGQWYHICLMSDGVTQELFLDGVSVATQTGGVEINTPTLDFVVGSVASGENPIDGWMDDVRITPGVTRYSMAGFTPPEAAFPTA